MSEYKLTTQQVEDGFSHEPEYEYSNPIGYGAHVQSNSRAFRRWLAEVELAAAEKALADAADECTTGYEITDNSAVASWLRRRAETYRQKDS